MPSLSPSPRTGGSSMRMLSITSTLLVILLLQGCSSVAYGFIESTTSLRSFQQQALPSPFVPPSSQQRQQQQQINSKKKTSTTPLFAEKPKKQKGVYVRPSGAIERGSGFFVPGLEGPKVRFVVGGVILLLTVINHFVMTVFAEGGSSENYYSLEESIAVIYSFLVLFQAAIEFGKEELVIEGGTSSSSSSSASSSSTSAATTNKDLVQKWSSGVSDEYKSRVQWAAASYVAVTPATQMLLLEKENGITYQLGNDLQPSSDYSQGVQAALEQLQKSSGGRVALPATHPAATGLGMTEARTVVLQRITNDSCWMMSSSDQLLASFTSSDLKWLGQLGVYVAS